MYFLSNVSFKFSIHSSIRLFGFPLFTASDSVDIFASNKKGVSKEIRKMILEEINSPKSCDDKQGTEINFVSNS